MADETTTAPALDPVEAPSETRHPIGKLGGCPCFLVEDDANDDGVRAPVEFECAYDGCSVSAPTRETFIEAAGGKKCQRRKDEEAG